MNVVFAVAVTASLIAALITQLVLQAGATTPPWSRTLNWAVPPLSALFAVVVWFRLSPYV
jgi:hypothetical protein